MMIGKQKIRTVLSFTVLAVMLACVWSPYIEFSEERKLTNYEKYLKEKKERKRQGQVKADMPDMHALIQRQLRTKEGDSGPTYGPNQVMEEFQKAKSRQKTFRARTAALNFVERGPGNVAGRTRSLLVDPDDGTSMTWYAGSASGGIWKTTNGGSSWTFISGDIPNLGTNTLAMSPANPQVIYAGTGEHFTRDIDGSGLFKSTDKGQSWIQIADPTVYPDFKNISRIVVDPSDENTVVVTSRNTVWGSGLEAAIYKTTDGGTNWTRLRSSTTERYDDIDVSPTDFNTLYVAVDEVGVIKSTDGGINWTDASNGLFPEGRLEITISPVNANRLWASVQGGLSGNGSDLYVSSDAGASWTIAVNSDGLTNQDFLGGQGWYDNIATAHPFDEDIVYVGGVNLWKFELGSATVSDVVSVKATENGSEAFMDYVDHGGEYFNGTLELGTADKSELLSIEVRFGVGSQKAHRFTVNSQGAGVPASGYMYEDYVEVPFQVWDTDNNQQLMVSFRDQQEDGAWNLITLNTDGDGSTHSREYLFFHSTSYSETPDASIGQNGGIEAEQMFFVWPVLTPGSSFDEDNLPTSNLAVDISLVSGVERITTNVSDAYGEFGGKNSFASQGTRSSGIHPDQHNIIITEKDDATQNFRYFVTNDGGVYQSVLSDDPGDNDNAFTYVSDGYNTTQFYGADKAPGEDRYIGGMQDNGTWYHPSGITGAANQSARFGIGGDGFEALWHSEDINKIVGGSQFNNFAKTSDGGATWQSATGGFNDNGPFITRLSHHKSLPDRVFTVGTLGVWRSVSFGGGWVASTMNEASLWSFNNSADVEVSYANPDVIWAGGALSSTTRLAVSTNGGTSFDAVENYDVFNMGSVSGIGTHPSDDQVAFALFSFAGFPKVLKTSDLGQTWQDISGFDGSGDRGFPDVAVNTIFVFPTDENQIWVGTEIGIVESLDGGASWSLLDSNLPSVNVYDFKQVENQLVIATYGRGIWSVEVPGILLEPSLERAFMSPDGDVNFTVDFRSEFDSTEVYLDDILIGTFYDNDLGAVDQKLQNASSDGDAVLRLDLYSGGEKFSTIETSVFVFQINETSDGFSTDFTNASADFTGSDFEILTTGSFDNKALHSPHPYPTNDEFTTYLRTPITVSDTDDSFYYRDVAIVQPGQSGSVFPSLNFHDYVVVEASSDGSIWKALEPGYDAGLYSDWLTVFNNDQDATPGLMRPHLISLKGHFDVGETILVRFRLFSDASSAGFGWVVDDLFIQEERPLGTDNIESELVIYPNPVKNFASFQFTGSASSDIQIFDLQGRQVDNVTVTERSSTWSTKNLSSGLYVVRYKIDGILKSQKIIVE